MFLVADLIRSLQCKYIHSAMDLSHCRITKETCSYLINHNGWARLVVEVAFFDINITFAMICLAVLFGHSYDISLFKSYKNLIFQ